MKIVVHVVMAQSTPIKPDMRILVDNDARMGRSSDNSVLLREAADIFRVFTLAAGNGEAFPQVTKEHLRIVLDTNSSTG
jgi:hypothetical protein